MKSAVRLGETPFETSANEAVQDTRLEALSRPLSPVAGGESPLGFRAGLAGAFGLGLVVYLSMSAGRHAHAQTVPRPAPPLYVANANVSPAQIAPPPSLVAPPAYYPPVANQRNAADELARLRAPSMVVDLSEAPAPDSQSAVLAQAAPLVASPAGGGGAPPSSSSAAGRAASDERFEQRVTTAQVETAHATRLASTSLIAPQGTVISAVLETGINSDVPGFARAVVSRDVSGFDGTTVVIPRGSRLIGEYKSAVAQGQSRAFVIWSRLLTPDGVSISLASPGTDLLGRGGLSGEVNTHFFHRFGAAILLSVISGGVEALANHASGGNAIIIGSPQQATNVASIALQKDIDIPTTISVPQGQAIRVFVSRDLDFSDVPQAR
jgi:type IV secretory pathway VirB10-like protein